MFSTIGSVKIIRVAAFAAAIVATYDGTAAGEPLPAETGKCGDTRIAELGSRLQGVPDSGSAVAYENGGVQVSYEMIPGLMHSRVGDTVLLCLASIPEDCPPGDDRGRIYRGSNLGTGETWEAADSQHSCGGA